MIQRTETRRERERESEWVRAEVGVKSLSILLNFEHFLLTICIHKSERLSNFKAISLVFSCSLCKGLSQTKCICLTLSFWVGRYNMDFGMELCYQKMKAESNVLNLGVKVISCCVGTKKYTTLITNLWKNTKCRSF